MKTIRVFFPEFETEAHRANWEGAKLVAALAEEGIECTLRARSTCHVAFVASFSTFYDAAHGYRKDPDNRPVLGYRHFPEIPVVHYCWDLYPFKLESEHEESPRWREYLKELRKATEIWVPSRCTIDRVDQYVGRGCQLTNVKVVKTSAPLWEPADSKVWDGRYVVDVVRKYPGELNAGLCKEVCEELGILCHELGDHARSWDDYRRLIAGATLLVSANYEASTGGLALLEGYRLGKTVLLSNSSCHGGVDYFGQRAHYFDWNNRDSLRDKLRQLWGESKHDVGVGDYREWVDAEYSNRAFAKRIAEGLRRVVG